MVRVLIVEDQIEVRRMLRAALETLRPDLSVTDIPSGEEALLLLSRQPFNLAVIDVRLAGISGLELMGKARQRNPDLKVILITGLSDPVTRQKIADAGAEDFFFKPVEMHEFIKAVDHCIGQAQQPSVSYGEGGVILETEPEGNILDLLSIFRGRIEALSVLLIDRSGRVLARSGDLPAELAELQILSLTAGAIRTSSEISGALGLDAPQDLLCFSGKRFDLVLFCSEQVALAAVVHTLAREATRLAFSRQAKTVLDEVSNLLPSLAEKFPEPAEIDAGAEEEVFQDLDQIFSLASREGYEAQDIQAFWEPGRPGSEQGDQPGDKRLSFEQARLLGLTPEE